MNQLPFSDAYEVSGALFWDRRRPRLQNAATPDLLAVRGQARTPAIPEERARYFIGVTEGHGLFRENAGVLACKTPPLQTS